MRRQQLHVVVLIRRNAIGGASDRREEKEANYNDQNHHHNRYEGAAHVQRAIPRAAETFVNRRGAAAVATEYCTEESTPLICEEWANGHADAEKCRYAVSHTGGFCVRCCR